MLSAPQLGCGRVNEAALVAQAVWPVAREQERPVEIDDARALCKEHRRRRGERGRHHAADHEHEAKLFRQPRHGERLGQAAGLVQLDVDGVVPADEGAQGGARMRALVGADGNRPRHLREHVVVLGRQGLLDQGDAGMRACGEVFLQIVRIPALVGIDDQMRRRAPPPRGAIGGVSPPPPSLTLSSARPDACAAFSAMDCGVASEMV